MKRTLTVALALAALFAFARGNAQPFPNKAFTIVVTTSAGGQNDTMARVWAESLRRQSGQSVLVENRAGGAGVVATSAMLAAPADGHTVMLAGNQIQTLLVKNVGYDPARVTPVSMVFEGPFTLVASKAGSVKSYRDFIDYARANPGKLTMGFVPGVHELNMRALEQALGISTTFVPYKGSAPLLQALFSGEVNASLFTSLTELLSGQLLGFATSGDARRLQLPDLPTFRELGINYDLRGVVSVWARSDTPAALLDRLNGVFVELVRSPESSEMLTRKLVLTPIGSTREQAVKYNSGELAMLKAVAEKAGIQPQ